MDGEAGSREEGNIVIDDEAVLLTRKESSDSSSLVTSKAVPRERYSLACLWAEIK